MIANHIHDALDQVRTLQEMILEKRQFMGYSGTARIASGLFALAGAALLASGLVPSTACAHLAGWGIVLALALVVNYASIAYWFFFDEEVRQNPRMVKPAVDAVPALAVAAAFSITLILSRQYDLLPGIWMCMYGLAQVAYRLSLPIGIYWVGLCYMLCGACYLLAPGTSFLNPWPMGITFFLGEMAGGLILLSRRRPQPSKNREEP